MKIENPIDKSELNGLAQEIDTLTSSINQRQAELIVRARANDIAGIKGITSDMQSQLDTIKQTKKKIQELENELLEKKRKIDKDYVEMEKMIMEKENGVWQSPIGGLEV